MNDIHIYRPGSLDPGAQPSVIATLDLSTADNYNRLLLFNVLNAALNRGYLNTMRVSPKAFSFRPITGWLVGRLTFPFNTKISYIRDKVLDGDLVPPS